jgi:hypothetical protein
VSQEFKEFKEFTGGMKQIAIQKTGLLAEKGEPQNGDR